MAESKLSEREIRERIFKEIGLTLNGYQNLARKTRLPTADLLYAVMGLSEETGEVNGLFSKARRKQVPVDRTSLKKELGDVLWMVAAIADDFELSLSEIAEHNIDKLSDRAQRGVIDGKGDTR